MKKTFFFLTCLLATATLWADEPTASVASVQIYYCQPENAVDNVVTKNPEYIWGGVTLTESGVYHHTFINRLGCDSTVTLTLTIEKPAFTAGSDDHKIVFAPGNLQWRYGEYTISGSSPIYTYYISKNCDNYDQDGKFRFAEHQWDAIGNNPANTAKNTESVCTIDGKNVKQVNAYWLDLMVLGKGLWGGSVANPYYPYPCDGSRPATSVDLTTNPSQDWGNFPIQNGDAIDPCGTWRSVTKDEMDYILEFREDAQDLVGYAIVNNVKGIILLPDGFEWNTIGLTFTPRSSLNNVGDNWQSCTNTYSPEDWSKIEKLGGVFLPLTGKTSDSFNYSSCTGTTFVAPGQGWYWTANKSDQYNQWAMLFDFGTCRTNNISYQSRCAVRLVKNAH